MDKIRQCDDLALVTTLQRRMRTGLLLAGFLTQLILGSACTVEIAAARSPDVSANTPLVGSMSLRTTGTCAAYREALTMSPIVQPNEEPRGCPDGSCYKNVPDLSRVAQQNTVTDGIALPTISAPEHAHPTVAPDCPPRLIDDPPLPPGVHTVVLRR